MAFALGSTLSGTSHKEGYKESREMPFQDDLELVEYRTWRGYYGMIEISLQDTV